MFGLGPLGNAGGPLGNAGGPSGNAGGPLGNAGGQNLNQEPVPSNRESQSSEAQRGRGNQRGQGNQRGRGNQGGPGSQIGERGRQGKKHFVHMHSSKRIIRDCLSPSRISPYRVPIRHNVIPFTLDRVESKVNTSSYSRCRDYYLNMAPDQHQQGILTEKENHQSRLLSAAGLSYEDVLTIKLK